MSDNKNQLVGLALCGGKSRRMEQDKALIKFHDRPQWQEVYHLLDPFCKTTIISLNPAQACQWRVENKYPVVIDHEKYQGHGPMTGLLSVIDQYPDRPIFLVACDYPYLTSGDLKHLINNRNHNFDVVCFETAGNPEPLITIFECSAARELRYFYQRGNDSILHFIRSVKTKLVSCKNPQAFVNVNTLAELHQFQQDKS